MSPGLYAKFNKLPLLLAGISALTLSPVAASVSLYAEYHLGEPGSLGTNNIPQDSSGTGKNFTGSQNAATSTTGTSGLSAPGSTACLDSSNAANEGWFAGNLYSTAPALATDNFAFGVYASAAANSSGTQGDVFTIGGNNGAFKLSLSANGWGASSHGLAWIGPASGVSGSFTANTWVHLALIRSGGTTTFYINGVAQAGTHGGAPVIDTAHLSVNPGGNTCFDGRIDEARVVTFSAGEATENILSVLQNGVMRDPVFSPAGGSTLGNQSVTISTVTPGATIHYTLDGGTPTTASPVYGTPIALTAPSTTTIQALAVRSGLPNSSVVSQTYTLLAGSTGVWTNPAGGSWPTITNWQSSAVAAGSGITADFSTLDLGANAPVTLDGSRTIGHLVFGDTTPDFNWSLAPGTGGTLTLAVASGSPTVTIHNQTATVSVPLAGTQGLTVAGAGKLILTGTNTYSGGTTINAGGTLQVGTGGSTGTLGTGTIVIDGLLDFNRGGTSADTVSLPSGAAISGSGSLSALANTVRLNGNITLGGAITLRENGSAGTYYEGLELASTTTLTASSITLYGNLGKRDSNGNSITLDTSAANGPINMQISTGLGNVWYLPNSVTVNAGTGTITIPGVGPGGPWALAATPPAYPAWNAPTSLRGAVQITGNVPASYPVAIEATGISAATGVLSGVMTLTKNGPASLTLDATNTYTGATTINQGTLLVNGSTAAASAFAVNSTATLGGTGAINGTVAINAGGTLAPGASVGTLTINNSLTLNAASAVVMEINKDGGNLTNDLVTGLTGTLNYAGTLTVSNTTTDGTLLAMGDKFTLFTKGSGGYAGAFTAINLPALQPGLRWETGGLLADGSIEVQSAFVASVPILSLGTGTYVGAQTVTISADPGATIRYTTDGSAPTASSPIFATPLSIPVNAVTTVQARAYQTGFTPSTVASATYTVWSTPIWLTAADESWQTDTNWSNLFIPNAPGLPADFSTLDLTTDVTVDLGGAVTIGSLVFGDTTPTNNWIFTGGSLTLAANSGTPVIDVVNQTTTVNAPVEGTQGLVKSGGGTLVLGSANSYSGNTTVNGGILTLKNTYVSTAFQIASGAALDFAVASGNLDGAGATITGTGTLRKSGAGLLWWYTGATTVSLGAGGLIDVQGGSITAADNGNDNWTGNLARLHVASGASFTCGDAEMHVDALSGGGSIRAGYTAFPNAQLICGVAGGSGDFSGAITNSASGACRLTKRGNGTQKLSGACTHTGTTTVEAGALIVNGSLAAGSAVTATAGTLGGTGTVNGTVAINATGTVAPGDAGIGTLHTGATTLAGTYACEVSGATSDVLAVTGNLVLTDSTLAVTGTPSGASLTIATYTGTRTGIFGGTPPNGYTVAYDETATPKTVKLVSTSGFASWARDNGVTGGTTGDSDNDGIKNLVEYALNLNPAASDGSAGTFASGTATYTKRTAATTAGDVRYIIETSPDLSTWTTVLTQNPGDPGYTDPTISYTLPTGQGTLFERLRIELIP